MLWKFAVTIADSALGRREICFSFSELLIKLLGGKKNYSGGGGRALAVKTAVQVADTFL